MDRRNFMGGLAGILASGYAPASVASGVLMPVRQLVDDVFPFVMTAQGELIVPVDITVELGEYMELYRLTAQQGQIHERWRSGSERVVDALRHGVVRSLR